MKQKIFASVNESQLPSIMPPGVHYPQGWGNGYVHLPIWHKYWGVDRGEIPYEAYRGLTWSDWDGKYWKIGFDTNHYGDDLERWPEEAVWNEANFLLHQAEMTDNPWLLRYWRILYRTPGMYWRLAREKWRTGDLVKLITNELRS